jgi:hypothetical protein
MLRLKRYLTRRLSPRQAVAVLALVVLLVGLVYSAYAFIAAKVLEARVRATIPRLCASMRQQRGVLITAIQAYKTHFGVYPPDHGLGRPPLVADAITNGLLYELAGVLYNPTNATFQVGQLEEADAKYVKDFFHCDGFRNSAQTPEQLKRFLPSEKLPVRQFHDDPDVFVLAFTVPFEELRPDVAWEILIGHVDISPWRYISSSPTNNPGRFDLWIDLEANHRKITIGNWTAVE